MKTEERRVCPSCGNFYAMEFVEGQTLERLIRRSRRIYRRSIFLL